MYKLIQGDCVQAMKEIEDNSIDLIATDPPYFRVKDDAWDNAWDSRESFLTWLGGVADEWKRILKPNGSLYVFASPQMAWHVEGLMRERFNVLNNISWAKHDGSGYGTGGHSKVEKESLRSFFPQTERIIFAEQFNSDNIALGESGYSQKCDELRGFIFEPLRAYLDSERQRAGVSVRQVAEAFQRKTGSRTVTGMAGHWFTSVQWTLPTKENYEWLRQTLSNLNHNNEYLRTEYEELRTEYEELRRPFFASPDVAFTDVWTFPTVQWQTGKHPCEKPLALMEHIVSLSSRPGATVLDCFLGSGTTGHACVKLDRRFIGIDLDSHWIRYSERRLHDAQRIAQRLPKQLIGKPIDYAELPMFSESFT